MFRWTWMLAVVSVSVAVVGGAGCEAGLMLSEAESGAKGLRREPKDFEGNCEDIADAALIAGWQSAPCDQPKPKAANYLLPSPGNPSELGHEQSGVYLEYDMNLPPSLDWRSNHGSFVTPPRDQGECGSCWAFASTGVLESAVLRTQGIPNASLDLSEQAVVSCSGAGSCEGGILGEVGTHLITQGIPAEGALPYTAKDGSCQFSMQAPTYQAFSYIKLDVTDDAVGAMKQALHSYGPLVTAMAVYEDFFLYQSGIYRHVSTALAGYHAVVVVGYNDEEDGYFIAKNSWGTWWGEQGFFRIAYSEVESSHLYLNMFSIRNFGDESYAISGASSPSMQVGTSVNADSFAFAANQLAVSSGATFARTTERSSDTGLSTELAGAKLQITDSTGASSLAALLEVSPERIMFEVPSSIKAGMASLGLSTVEGDLYTAKVRVQSVAPTLFTAAPNSRLASGNIYRIRADGSSVWEPLVDKQGDSVVARPVDMSQDGESVFLVLYGTGMRHISQPHAATATVDNQQAELTYVGAQGTYVGLDQVNIRLSPDLKGRGRVNVGLTVDGLDANQVELELR